MGQGECRCIRKGGDSGSEGPPREFTRREEVKKGVAKQENRKAEGADQIVNELINNWEKECLPYWLCFITLYIEKRLHP